MGWGISPYGLGAYGIGSLSIDGAVVITRRSVRVQLSLVPRAITPYSPGDVFNPATWSVQRLDTLVFFTVLKMQQVATLLFDIYVLEAFGSHFIQHQVSSLTLRSAGGALIVPPTSADFSGAELPKEREKAPVRTIDLANEGTLRVLSGGDYAEVSGLSLIKKLIFRRITTALASFFHLPEYGLALAVKQLMRGGDLVTLKAVIDRQVKEEPEVIAVRSKVSFDAAHGILLIQLRATVAPQGDSLDVSLQVSDAGVTF